METPAPLTMTISFDLVMRLRDVGCGRIAHLNKGLCPYDSRIPSVNERRDPACPACNVLDAAAAACQRAVDLAFQKPTPPAIVKRQGLLTTTELAALAYCDPKTVINHAKAGKIVSVNQHSGHLRFTAEAARDYVRFAGYTVPAWLEALASP